MYNNFLQNIIEKLEKNAAKIYLVVANMILVIFAIWFSNAGLLPFVKVSDFIFFILLSALLAVYRPSWMFAFFIGTLALENINLAPKEIGIMVRPFQFFGALTIFSILIQYFIKRLNFSFPKWKWFDYLPLFFAFGGFISSFSSLNFAISFKQAIIASSFVAFYYLTRIYIQSLEDLKRIAPFFLSSGLVVSFYGIWQNIRFLAGKNAFEIMPGRPNATFTEPDWFGIYLVFLLSIIFAIIYFESKKTRIFNFKFLILNQFQISNFKFQINYVILIPVIIALILTVSRSAWLGAALVVVGFLKVTLTNGSLKISKWNWKEFALQASIIAAVVSISLLISTQLTNFQIFKRAQSTGGLQKITVACEQSTMLNADSVIGNIEELERYGCKFINLEEIEKEKSQGLNVFEIKRPDPTVGIRAQIYKKVFEQIKSDPIFGIGWGSISEILGKDENGNGLNASNIFLEIWLGSGLVGVLSVMILFAYILIMSLVQYLDKKIKDKTAVTFAALGLFAIVIPNLFNSGIFLGFVWAYLAAAVSLLGEKSKR